MVSDAAPESEKQPNARQQSASLDRLAWHHAPSTKELRPSTSAPVSVGVCSSVVIILAPSFAIKDLVVAVVRQSLTRSAVIADGLFFNLHYLAALTRRLADSIAKDRRTAVIRKSPITAMEMKLPALNVLFSPKRLVCAARRPSRTSNAGLRMCVVGRFAEGN